MAEIDEFTAAVADRVMGWPVVAEGDPSPDEMFVRYVVRWDSDPPALHCNFPGEHGATDDWNPMESADDDYEVLCHAREAWKGERWQRFRRELSALWQDREQEAEARMGGIITNYGVLYEIGDYARAALSATEGEASR